jgi:hypothetical protein
MCRYDCCHTFGYDVPCEPDDEHTEKQLNNCPYCEQPVYQSDERVHRAKQGYAHMDCWRASDDGA